MPVDAASCPGAERPPRAAAVGRAALPEAGGVPPLREFGRNTRGSWLHLEGQLWGSCAEGRSGGSEERARSPQGGSPKGPARTPKSHKARGFGGTSVPPAPHFRPTSCFAASKDVGCTDSRQTPSSGRSIPAPDVGRHAVQTSGQLFAPPPPLRGPSRIAPPPDVPNISSWISAVPYTR